MSRGTQIYAVRLPQLLIDQMTDCIRKRNATTRDAEWTLSDFIRRACAEKVAHMARSRKPKKKA